MTALKESPTTHQTDRLKGVTIMKSPITKTVKYTYTDYDMSCHMLDYCYMPKEGDEVVLISHVDEMTGAESWYLNPYIPGTKSCERVHGWRGTYNNDRMNAHGVRRVLKVTETTGKMSRCGSYEDVTIFSFKVGKDLYPEIA